MNKVFVYGTLRTKGKDATHYLSGYALYNAGPYPYIVRDNDYEVLGEVIEVTDDDLAQLDRYENIASGLYTREEVQVDPISGPHTPPTACFAYVAGKGLPHRVSSGDWFNKE